MRAFLTSLSSSLILFSWVYLTSTSFLLWACSRANLGLLEIQLFRGLRGLRDVALLEHPRGPLESIRGAGQVAFGKLDLALDRGQVPRISHLLIFLEGDLGELAGQPGDLVGGFGLARGQLLRTQPGPRARRPAAVRMRSSSSPAACPAPSWSSAASRIGRPSFGAGS